MRVMITGGGTGGHTSPAVAIIEELRKRDPRLVIQWVGCNSSIEQRVCARIGEPFRSLPVAGWPRKRSLRQVWVGIKLLYSMVRAFFLLKQFRPQVVVGVGGYVSLPLCYIAQRLGIPTVLHEQNKRLGMANRLLAPRATRIMLGYPDTLGKYPQDAARVVGNPVRAGFMHPPSQIEARKTMNLEPETPVILVVGGSQGAHTLNTAMGDVIKQFSSSEVQFVWMTGEKDVVSAKNAATATPVRVDVYPFIDDMVSAFAAADLIVSRAGASSTAEIALMGKPSILVPYPHATDNHQEHNARAFVDAGAAVMLLDTDCTSERLTTCLHDLLSDPTRLANMSKAALKMARPGAAEAIVEEILLLAFES